MMHTNGPTIECSVQFKRGQHGRKRLVSGQRCSAPAQGRVPRIARLTALAIKLDGQIRCGELRDWAEVARLGHVTRARAAHIAGLLMLAPEVIESLLHLPEVLRGRDPITERDLRPIAAEVNWAKQRKQWGILCRERGVTTSS